MPKPDPHAEPTTEEDTPSDSEDTDDVLGFFKIQKNNI
jgi:hypothetical protein